MTEEIIRGKVEIPIVKVELCLARRLLKFYNEVAPLFGKTPEALMSEMLEESVEALSENVGEKLRDRYMAKA